MKDPSKEFMMPFISALTALLWVEAALEALTRGAMYAPTPLADLYLTLMGAYAGAGEVQKWLQKDPADPAQDPWMERAQKGGAFVALWMTLLIAVHLWQLHDSTLPMPADLKPVTTGLVVIFFAKIASRHVRHSRRGLGGPAGAAAEADQAVSAREAVIELLGRSPEGLELGDIVAQLPGYSQRHILRELSALKADQTVERTGVPRARDARYHLTGPGSLRR